MPSTSLALSLISFHSRRSSSASWLLARFRLREDIVTTFLITRRKSLFSALSKQCIDSNVINVLLIKLWKWESPTGVSVTAVAK